MLVNFLIAGTQKGGTTALYDYCLEHSQLSMSKNKEVHFFDNESHFSITPPPYEKYHRLFEEKPGALYGEATPVYMYWHNAIRRIYQYNPDMKIILLLRNPITRAFSSWNMEKSVGRETLSFSEAIKQEIVRCKRSLPLQDRNFSYTDRGFYTAQIRNIWHYFPKEQCLILKSDELKTKPEKALDMISGFLQIKPFNNISPKASHAINYASQLAMQDFEYLADYFYYEIKQLEKMLEWDCSDWLEHPIPA